MRSRKISQQELQSACAQPGPDDGVDPRFDRRGETGKVANRKARQLCAQAARTLRGVLAESGEDLLRDLLVESVVLAPNTARLLVSVLPTAEDQANRVLECLERARGRLRSEMAAAINRRRTPDLIFRIVRATN